MKVDTRCCGYPRATPTMDKSVLYGYRSVMGDWKVSCFRQGQERKKKERKKSERQEKRRKKKGGGESRKKFGDIFEVVDGKKQQENPNIVVFSRAC